MEISIESVFRRSLWCISRCGREWSRAIERRWLWWGHLATYRLLWAIYIGISLRTIRSFEICSWNLRISHQLTTIVKRLNKGISNKRVLLPFFCVLYCLFTMSDWIYYVLRPITTFFYFSWTFFFCALDIKLLIPINVAVGILLIPL
jgi:hypothetical protein